MTTVLVVADHADAMMFIFWFCIFKLTWPVPHSPKCDQDRF